MEDVAWIRGCGETFKDMPDDCLGQWFDLVKGSGKKANQALNKACKHPKAQISAAEWPFPGEVADAGIVVDSDDEPLSKMAVRLTAPVVEKEICADCGMSFPDKTSLQMHGAVLHKKKTKVRLHFNATYCQICCLEFHSRVALMDHLYKTVICHANLLACPQVHTEEECEPMDEECRKFRECNKKKLQPKHGSGMPCVRRLGPYLPVRGADGSIIQTSNGHPLSSDHPWHRSPFLKGVDESLDIIGCPASLRAPCKTCCILCAQKENSQL